MRIGFIKYMQDAVERLISYKGVATADGAADFSTIIDSNLPADADYDGQTVIIKSGTCNGESRIIFGATTGGTITVANGFGGVFSARILAGTKFVITGISWEEPCFLLGTKILLADNSYKNIEDVEIHDVIMSYDESTNSLVPSTVTNTFIHDDETSYLVINDTIRPTPNHPFCVNNEWKEASEIKEGDVLLHRNGSDIPVTSIRTVIENVTVYNLEVDKYHNYFAENILVHNKCPRVFTHNGDDYVFDALINVLYVGKEGEKLFAYPLKHLKEPKMRIEYDPDEINYVNFVKLLIKDTHPSFPTKECTLNPTNQPTLRERDDNYIILDEKQKEIFLTFESLPELLHGYEREIFIHSCGYQDVLRPTHPECDYIDDFLKEYDEYLMRILLKTSEACKR